MIEVITRECKKSGKKTRVSIQRLIDILEANYDDPLLVLLEAAKGTPINTTFAVYRVEEFSVCQTTDVMKTTLIHAADWWIVQTYDGPHEIYWERTRDENEARRWYREELAKEE